MAGPAPHESSARDAARARMVERQIASRGVTDPAVLGAMRTVPREAFVPEHLQDAAFDDSPLPIEQGQTISQPYIVALMVEAAALRPGDRVLEIGAGSGYAAAVMARIAGHVDTVERHAPLAASARAALAAAGASGVTVHEGDGSLGLPRHAPFDAILVAAGAPVVPEALKAQLAPGGRLIVPVGDVAARGGQALLRITRTAADRFEEETVASVRFVPLVGAQGFPDPDASKAALPQAARATAGQAAPGRAGQATRGPAGQAAPTPAEETARAAAEPAPNDLAAAIAAAAEPLPDIEDPGFAAAFDRFGDRRVVLLGESTHGTSEFYRARAAITRRLVERHGFTAVAVEADWPDAAAFDRFTAHRAPRADPRPPFARFPQWMWRNTVMEGFAHWLRAHNGAVSDPARRVRFHGLDLYNMRGAVAAVLDYLDRVDPEAAEAARERYGCLTPWQSDPAAYGRAVLTRGMESCEDAVVAQLVDLLKNRLDYAQRMDGEALFEAAESARLVRSAERYYREMYRGGSAGWNLRDRHMADTLERVLEAGGSEAKVVVWAHNSHVGDARATDMGRDRDQLSLGQLVREAHGRDAALIGLGTERGTVAAADDWGGEMQVMDLRPGRPDSLERACADAGLGRFLLQPDRDPDLAGRLAADRLQRFVGVIYRPRTERESHYVDAALAQQYDAWLWFDETCAVSPLDPAAPREGLPETWPFGV